MNAKFRVDHLPKPKFDSSPETASPESPRRGLVDAALVRAVAIVSNADDYDALLARTPGSGEEEGEKEEASHRKIKGSRADKEQ